MRKNFTHFIVIASLAFTSCNSIYKNTQMPDDLYYAPATLKVEKKEEPSEEEKQKEREESFLKRKVADRNRWNRIDDFSYWNDVRFNHCNCNCNNNWNSWNNSPNIWNNTPGNLTFFNNFNNPYTLFIPYVAPNIVKNINNFTPIKAFGNNTTNNNNFVFNPKLQALQGNNNTSNTNGIKTQGLGGKIIRLFGGNNSSSMPSSNAGGQSGGFKSTGSSSSTPRSGRAN